MYSVYAHDDLDDIHHRQPLNSTRLRGKLGPIDVGKKGNYNSLSMRSLTTDSSSAIWAPSRPVLNSDFSLAFWDFSDILFPSREYSYYGNIDMLS